MSVKVYALTDPILIDLAQDGDVEGLKEYSTPITPFTSTPRKPSTPEMKPSHIVHASATAKLSAFRLSVTLSAHLNEKICLSVTNLPL